MKIAHPPGSRFSPEAVETLPVWFVADGGFLARRQVERNRYFCRLPPLRGSVDFYCYTRGLGLRVSLSLAFYAHTSRRYRGYTPRY